MSLFSKETRDLLDKMAERIIEDPSVPEYMKVSLRLNNVHRRIENKLHAAWAGFAKPELSMEEEKRTYPEKKAFLEYMLLMEAGLDSFLKAHPAPPVPGYLQRE